MMSRWRARRIRRVLRVVNWDPDTDTLFIDFGGRQFVAEELVFLRREVRKVLQGEKPRVGVFDGPISISVLRAPGMAVAP